MKFVTLMSLAVVVLLSTVGVAETKSDYDHHYKLTRGSTWDFKQQRTTAKDSFGDNVLWDRRVRDDLKKDFADAGLLQFTNGAPDLLVSYHLGANRGVEREYLTTGYPGFGRFGFRRWGWGSGWNTTTVWRVPYLKSTLVMDVYDAHTKQLIWRGYDTKTIDYNKADNTINKSVDHLAKRFEHDMKTHGGEG